jgi:hypothetical protein
MSDRLRSLLHFLTIPAILAAVWFPAHVKSLSVKDTAATWQGDSGKRRGTPFTAPFELRIMAEPMSAPNRSNAPTTTHANPDAFATADANTASE